MCNSGYSLLLIVSVCWVFIPLINGNDVVLPLVIAPHCSDMCGNISIPYPFGIEEGCYLREQSDTARSFKINCTSSHNTSPSTPIFGNGFEVLNISTVEGELRTKLYISHDCYNNTGHVDSFRNWFNLVKFTLSATKNILVAVGCDTYAWFTGVRGGKNYAIGCMTKCVDLQDVIDGECSGIGCCQASIPGGINNVTVEVDSFHNHTSVYSFNPCSVAFPVAKDAFTFYRKNLSWNLDYYNNLQLPVVFNWTIGQNNCSVAKADGSCLCKANTTECYDPLHELGYRCKCKQGYSGNPYLPHGCTDIDECKLNSCEKPEYCTNTLGSYSCTCPKGYYGNATKDSPCSIIDRSSQSHKKLVLAIKIIIGIGGGVIVSLLAGLWFNWQHNNTKLQKIRETRFRQNGGHILQQKLLGRDVSVGNNVKMFTVEQLEKATDNYSENSIIGRGGFGMVFKGTLSSKELSLNNNQVVAIKRSIKVDSTQVEQFINEVVALSQINNKNVVKLLGCCLETEVPLLVYEYISNGTLYEHLHDEGKMSSVVLSWDIRLRIAAEVADVLAYLHTTISVPIIHRDIKSANILLDENFTAKVADFGASKLVPADQEQLGTMVQGTCGYLDPEYMQTGELTDKSDVYSFGVVLVELLTREKAISYAKPETERSLAVCFLRKLKEDRLIDILDEKIVSDGAIMGQLKAVADVGRMCLKLKGEDRPTMKEVARELDGIRGMGVHPWSSNMEEETEYLLGQTHVFNDGVTDSWNCQSRVVELGPFDDGR